MGGSRREAAGVGAAQKGKGMIRHLLALAALELYVTAKRLAEL